MLLFPPNLTCFVENPIADLKMYNFNIRYKHEGQMVTTYDENKGHRE